MLRGEGSCGRNCADWRRSWSWRRYRTRPRALRPQRHLSLRPAPRQRDAAGRHRGGAPRSQAGEPTDADLALSHARFLGFDSEQAATYASLAGFPAVQIGNAPGNYIPNAPALVASAGVTLGHKTGWFGTVRWRYLGPTPLTEDNAFRAPPVSIVNARIGYGFDNGWRVSLDLLNLLNAKADQISYAYGSLIKTDSLNGLCSSAAPPPAAVCRNGVMDRILHPIEPLAARITVTAKF
jgi:TonB-dependent receptor-like protein